MRPLREQGTSSGLCLLHKPETRKHNNGNNTRYLWYARDRERRGTHNLQRGEFFGAHIINMDNMDFKTIIMVRVCFWIV